MPTKKFSSSKLPMLFGFILFSSLAYYVASIIIRTNFDSDMLFMFVPFIFLGVLALITLLGILKGIPSFEFYPEYFISHSIFRSDKFYWRDIEKFSINKLDNRSGSSAQANQGKILHFHLKNQKKIKIIFSLIKVSNQELINQLLQYIPYEK